MENIIIFGASGQLGQCLKKVLENTVYAANWQFLSESEANVLDTNKLKTVFEKYTPAAVVNCAAYTAVDKAEDEVEQAYNLNAHSLTAIAELCALHQSKLLHISTDFVFDGELARPLTEKDTTAPISVYGASKLEGEKAIIEKLSSYFIIRTSWLYSEFGNNFVKTMLRLAAERDVLNVVADQVGTPTYAIDLAGAIVNILKSDSEAYGTYHYSNEGVASWYDFAKAIFELSDSAIAVNPVPTAAYVTKAARPAYSVLDKAKIKEVFALQIPYWRDSLKKCLQQLKG